ncbi:MAG TPA: glucose 1-dehydrogenase [Actinomycetales bacterium]|nr:glucose 1-dehydrogenase [Actinomycetales bacterium]
MTHRRFCGATAVVTGGARGIGRACVERLSAEGADIVIVDIDRDAAEQVAGFVHESTGRVVHHMAVDVADPEAVGRLGSAIGEVLPSADVLVNAAGVTSRVPFLDMTVAEWDRVMNINLRGSFLVSQVFARDMVERGAGAIVNLASVNAEVVRHPDHNVYTASKAGIVGLTKAMAASLSPRGVRVNAVAPGPVGTELLAPRLAEPGGAKRLLRNVLLQRVCEPAEVAAAVAFLASHDAEYITGTSLTIDGGLLVGAEA